MLKVLKMILLEFIKAGITKGKEREVEINTNVFVKLKKKKETKGQCANLVCCFSGTVLNQTVDTDKFPRYGNRGQCLKPGQNG